MGKEYYEFRNDRSRGSPQKAEGCPPPKKKTTADGYWGFCIRNLRRRALIRAFLPESCQAPILKMEIGHLE